ncbi:hypothetical protein Agabi119p4_11188 [Agaricus bisporus var. burnettii]|uniref:hAT-like transposase RNase-H fold domain-containing protein n=1 Tax=Agaricus bisporus var. burnettii TaxID=192524 RepID=A0A8H7EW28_AGABI|nr:hypothetical protein Agabi119p4_11188 [Agaricus bisporus var. burnettii]
MGLKTLNWYYSTTNLSEVYRIAMVLDPRYKTAYFHQAGWEEQWIDVAIQAVNNATDQYMAYTLTSSPVDNDADIIMVDNPLFHALATSTVPDDIFDGFLPSMTSSPNVIQLEKTD